MGWRRVPGVALPGAIWGKHSLHRVQLVSASRLEGLSCVCGNAALPDYHPCALAAPTPGPQPTLPTHIHTYTHSIRTPPHTPTPHSTHSPNPPHPLAGSRAPRLLPPSASSWVVEKRGELQALMWHGAGIVRSVPDMRAAHRRITALCMEASAMAESYGINTGEAGLWFDCVLFWRLLQVYFPHLPMLCMEASAMAKSCGVNTGEAGLWFDYFLRFCQALFSS